jgi:hypothetical protein
MFSKRLLVLVMATASLSACGGGGGDTSATGASAGAESRTLSATESALVMAPPGLSGNVTCDNMSIGALSLDSVTVPANAACFLTATSLVGSVMVGNNATLVASAVRVNGNVIADGAADVVLADGAMIGGAVQVKQGGSASVNGAFIIADLQIDAMRGAVSATGNDIGGNLQAIGNLGGLVIQDNTMGGNLQCKENQPPPVIANNTAALIEDQCLPGASGGGTAPAPGPLSGNVTCNGLEIGAVSLDTVIVPAGESCVLDGTTLIGSILVGQGANLRAMNVRANGNLVAEGAAQTVLSGASRIGGSVQIKQGGSASVTGAIVTGDVQFDQMSGPVSASANAIGGNLQVMTNTGGVALTANHAVGAIQCKDNQPVPVGSGNVASIKQDQCEGL